MRVLTDSGDLREEAYGLGLPCLTLRDETEWVKTAAAGWSVLVGSDTKRIISGVETFAPPVSRPLLLGEGRSASRCVALRGSIFSGSAVPMAEKS